MLRWQFARLRARPVVAGELEFDAPADSGTSACAELGVYGQSLCEPIKNGTRGRTLVVVFAPSLRQQQLQSQRSLLGCFHPFGFAARAARGLPDRFARRIPWITAAQMYWARQQRSTIRVFRTRCQAMNPHIEFIDDRTAVGAGRNLGPRNRQTDRRPDGGANAVTKLQDEQREPERQAVPADEMEKGRVLPLEIYRQDRGARLLNETDGKQFPRQFFRCAERL